MNYILASFPGVAHVALFDFDGNDNRELSVKQGELVYVSQKETLGWVKVVNSDNLRGWVPTSYLVQVSQSQLASTQQTVEVRLLACLQSACIIIFRSKIFYFLKIYYDLSGH